MRRFALLFAGGSLVSWALAISVSGCDDLHPPSLPAVEQDGSVVADAGTSSSGTTGSSGSTGNTSSSSGNTSSSGSTDASDDAPSSSSGDVLSNPGKVTCGSTECDAGFTSVCCTDGGAGACMRADQCEGPRLELRCDERADCQNIPRACCRLRLGGGSPRASCDSCDSDDIRVCKTNADCGDGGANQPTCGPKKCGAFNVRVCGNPAGCQP